MQIIEVLSPTLFFGRASSMPCCLYYRLNLDWVPLLLLQCFFEGWATCGVQWRINRAHAVTPPIHSSQRVVNRLAQQALLLGDCSTNKRCFSRHFQTFPPTWLVSFQCRFLVGGKTDWIRLVSIWQFVGAARCTCTLAVWIAATRFAHCCASCAWPLATNRNLL